MNDVAIYGIRVSNGTPVLYFLNEIRVKAGDEIQPWVKAEMDRPINVHEGFLATVAVINRKDGVVFPK